ncbi:MAG: PAC2 family protein [Thermodesulfobacteriota bacterium]
MRNPGFLIESRPHLDKPVLIAGFDGWGNALNISKGMIAYLVGKFKARPFARLNPDTFYRYDENRPLVNIRQGNLKSLKPPGGKFYAARTGASPIDLVLLKADEPGLAWYTFADELFSLCEDLGVETIITLGSMYDNVLHSDRIVSALASDPELFNRLKQKNVVPVSYQGPSAIHSVIQSEGAGRGFKCVSLWCHCPYYLQGVTHFGIMSHLASLLGCLGGFEMDVADLQDGWEELNTRIQELIKTSPELEAAINKLRKAKLRGSWEKMKTAAGDDQKVIHLQDFLEPK